uniref:Uncharacterized protein n=1 Tax=Anopheles melas TaxID=34690 RepID=A0A182TPN6_9DIPT
MMDDDAPFVASPPPNPLLLLPLAAAEIALLVVGGALIVAELYAGNVGFDALVTVAALAAAAAGKRGLWAPAIIAGIIGIPGGTMYGLIPPIALIIGFMLYAACKCGGIIFCICIIPCDTDAAKI